MSGQKERYRKKNQHAWEMMQRSSGRRRKKWGRAVFNWAIKFNECVGTPMSAADIRDPLYPFPPGVSYPAGRGGPYQLRDRRRLSKVNRVARQA